MKGWGYKVSDLHARIQRQYASDRGRSFYRSIMGDGGFDIHYGLYAHHSTTMRQATRAATDRLLELTAGMIRQSEIASVLDLGSGTGGPARYLATACQSSVTCVDLCAEHHQENLQQARLAGIENSITTWLGSFESLPSEWSDRFDLVWAQESFCHAADIGTLLEEAFRVTAMRGVIAFTDIMVANEASESDASAFSSVNAVTRLSSPVVYRCLLESTGYQDVQFEDWTEHLEVNFDRMLKQIHTHRDRLIQAGVDQPYLDEFTQSLNERIRQTRDRGLCWGAFTARRG